MGDKLISGVLWLIVITGILFIVGSYWVLTVVVPAIFAGIVLMLKFRNVVKTKTRLKIRPAKELDSDPQEERLFSISDSNIRIVRVREYEENWQRIVEELEVDSAETFPIEGSLRVFRDSHTNSPNSGSDADWVVLACVDYLVVGEVARVQIAEMLPSLLGQKGAGLCILNTAIDSHGAVSSVRAFPVPHDDPWWKI